MSADGLRNFLARLVDLESATARTYFWSSKVNDFESMTGARPPVVQEPISENQAVRTTQQDAAPALAEFILALQMRRPVSTDQAAGLFKHLVKHQMASDDVRIADQMRDDGWEAALSDGETLTVVAQRAFAYLSTHEGVSLFNFFVKTYAKTNGTMFE